MVDGEECEREVLGGLEVVVRGIGREAGVAV